MAHLVFQALFVATLLTSCQSSGRGLHGLVWHVVPSSTGLTPSPTPTPAPTPSPTSHAVAGALTAATPVPTRAPTPTPTPTRVPTPTPKPTKAPTPTTTPTPTRVPTPTFTPTPTRVPTPTLTPTPTRAPTPSPSPSPTPIPTPQPALILSSTGLTVPAVPFDVMYDDDYIHFGALNRIQDWNSMDWGVINMAAGARLNYDKFLTLPYTSWRFIHDPMDSTPAGPDNAILMGTNVLHVVSRDLKLCWYADPSGYVTLMDYATALKGDLTRIRARIVDKHGQAALIGAPLPRGFHWVKMKFDAAGGSDLTPTDSGLAWQPKTDSSYVKNHALWYYGFEVQDVDWTDPSILRKAH